MEVKDSSFNTNYHINCKGKLIDLSTPKIMGIVNATPDSFYDGGKNNTIETALQLIDKQLEDGATFIDIGGYSSRPGADDISELEEIKRVVPIIEAVINKYPEAIISVDTFRKKVAEHAIEAGACIVNDISAGKLDDEMHPFILEKNIPYIGMHMKGTPQNMQQTPVYKDLVPEIIKELSELTYKFAKAGHTDLILDPGFGFGKTIEDNYELLNQLEAFHILKRPLLVGVSRKSMIYKKLEIKPEDSLSATTSLNTISLLKSTSILRVHDVKEAQQLIKLLDFQQLNQDNI